MRVSALVSALRRVALQRATTYPLGWSHGVERAATAERVHVVPLDWPLRLLCLDRLLESAAIVAFPVEHPTRQLSTGPSAPEWLRDHDCRYAKGSGGVDELDGLLAIQDQA